jgi:hypothetical protein
VSSRPMSARDGFLQRLGGALADRANPAALTEALDLYDAEKRAEVLLEAADFVRDAHFRDGLSVQEIGTALRFMAGTNTTQET